MFRNIFDYQYHSKSHEGVVEKTEGADEESTANVEAKLPIKTILELCKNSQDQIKVTLNDILVNSDFSKLTLSITKKYFKGLEDSEKESRVIHSMLSLEEVQLKTLNSILYTFCEITNFIKFSNTMINLDKIYKFKTNNNNVYEEFIALINNVDSSFDKIFNASKKLSELRNKYIEKRNIENVLFELSEDQDLIMFLLNTPEDDIRNMVDAVDEHGDSFIRVQTIRDLLIIGSFVRRLQLKEINPEKPEGNPSEEEFVESIHGVFGKNNFTGIEVLMNSCSKQFTGIKHLHGELSNREEASKIKAKEISKQSRFEFAFNSSRDHYEVICYYGKANKKINFRDLCDLRDRVLLLLYNEKDQKEDAAKDVVGLNKKMSQNQEEEALLKKTSSHMPEAQKAVSLRDILSAFIKSVEISEKILFVLQDIYHNGYPNHFTTNINLKDGIYNSFSNMYNEMSELNRTWNEDLKDAYTKHYALCLFTGNQFWELESILIKAAKSGTEDIDNLPGFYLIKYANPIIKAVDLDKVSGNYSDLDSTILNAMKPKDRILKLGEAINQLINVESLGEKPLTKDSKKVHLNLKGNRFIFSSINNMKIYTYLLSIHFSIENRVPCGSQIFYCSKDTTFHELISFLYRTVYSPVVRLFTMIKVENLSFELQNFLVEQVNKLSKLKGTVKGYLSIICSDQNSFLHTQFSENNQLYLMRDFDVLDDVLIANCLKALHLNTTIVRSDDTGAGKTFWIRSRVVHEKQEYVDFPILDVISLDRINTRLYKYNKSSKNTLDKFIHLTILGVIDDYEMLDFILFSYIILGNITSNLNVSFRDINDPLYIEVANTYNDFLFSAISIFNLLPDTEFLTAEENFKTIKINKEFNDPLQMVANYLYYYDLDQLNDTDINPEVEINVRVYSKEECVNLLQKYFIKSNPEITFRQIHIFLQVLANQLDKFSQNYYFSVENIGYIEEESLMTIRQKIMTCLLKMTEEFTTRSIKEAREQQNMTVFKLKRSYSREEHRDNDEAKIEEFDSLSNILSWSSSNHLLVMFHADGMCVTPVYREADKVTEEIRELVESQRTNLEDYQVFSHFELLEKLLNIVGKEFQLEALSKQTKYILTADNFLKMLLIIMRARCGIPIVIMGETGCGKTSLVRFLATEIMQEGFEVINFHAGIKEHHIIEKMEEVIEMAHSAQITENSIWVFLDEINTCDCLGLITELIVQKSMLGRKLPENIVFIAACNPYKVRRAKGEVGLIKQRVATRLVYRVHPLPDSLIDYVWDYGSLSDSEERLYIGNILQEISGEIKSTSIDLVCKSQQFIRNAEDKYSVSLRDVARFHILHEWFFTMLNQKNEDLLKEKGFNNVQYINYINYFGTTNVQIIKYKGKLMISRKALILSLMMCYYNRISKNSDRNEYKLMITKSLNISVKELDEMINEEQRDMVTRMELPPAIAINKALLENVFTLMVCVINKIPLFICGKPGCSKSLSVQLLVSNLRGADSHDPFFKKLPRILAIPYQGSESSTSEGIEKIFEKARGVLNNSHDNSILPLIVFDEIGLAEISKNNPLKILHSLLEPEKAELAFVGISNWRLDASKMNRAVYLARPDPDLEDLENTALSIFEYYIKEPRFDERQIMKSLAKTYYEFKKAQKEDGHQDFHGTRDFYALLKQVTREFNQHYTNYNEMKLPILRDALCRNFGGLDNSIKSILEIFARNMNLPSNFVNPVDNPKLEISNDVVNLVKENLKDRESRFLLLFTNGESASYILDNYLKMDLKERIFIIGSEFVNDKDKEEHSFKLLSDIILYMESGNSIIMKNLDQIYGSLYDLFNQNFMIVGEKKNCRIALGSTNNPMCYVNNAFHCVVLVDLKDLNRMDPPFLNRFEKQILTFETILTPRQKEIVKELNQWIKQLTSLAGGSNNENNIDVKDLIITYNEEMAPSIVLTHFTEEKTNEDILEICKKDVLKVSSISLIVYSILSRMYQNARDEVLKSHRIYFEEQSHDSLDLYLSETVKEKAFENKSIVYTYSNILDEFKLESISIDLENPEDDVIPEETANKEDEGKENKENTVSGETKTVEKKEGMEKLDDETTKTDQPKEEEKPEEKKISMKIKYEKGNINNSKNIAIISIAELKSEKEFDSRFKAFLNNPDLEWVFIKFDAEKEKKHIPMIKFKIDKFISEAKKALGENSVLSKNVLMIIYLSRKQIGKESASAVDRFAMGLGAKDDILESHFLSGWDQNMIDCLAGGQISNLKNLLDLTTIEIIKKNIDQKSIAELIFDIYLKFNFNTYNPNDSSLVKLYMTESIHKIENDSSIFEVIFKKCLEFLEEKELPDWKLKICCDSKILSKSVNTFSAIKLVIQDIVCDPLLKIVHYLETESALSSYFHEETTKEKAEIFKKIWVEQFEKKDLNAIYPYNVVQSLNVNCVFNLTFPFSKSDIYEVVSGLKSHIDAIFMLDNAAYSLLSEARSTKNTELQNKIIGSDTFLEMKMNFSNEIDTVGKQIKNKSILFQIINNYSERSLEFCYISDLIAYFTIVELKKEYKWKNCLEIIIRKCVGFDIENLEYIYIFLYKNRKILDSVFNVFNTLQNVYDVQFIENILLKDSIYDKDILNISDLHLRKNAELNTFLNIFNTFSQVIISQLNSLKTVYEKSKEDIYGLMLNVYISSLMNFSLEIEDHPDALNVIVVVNEFLKFLSNVFNNNKEEIAKRAIGIVSEKYEDISIKDFSLVKEILNVIDKELVDLQERAKNPDNEIPSTLISFMKTNVISSKLTIFESVLTGNCEFDNKKIIVENILKDEELTRYSGMIFKLIYKDCNITENLSELYNHPITAIIVTIIDSDDKKYDYDGIICSFFSDFFRKFYRNDLTEKEYLTYLNKEHENFSNTLANCHISNKSTSKYNRLIGFSLIKHYLDIYGKYISSENITPKDAEISEKMNKILENPESFVEILKNFVLKTFASKIGGTAAGLVNVNYNSLNVKWVNNKVFETNDNALGLEPNLISFEKLNKEYSLFFVSLLNEDSKEILDRFKNLIKESKDRSDLKFLIIQFFINKVWLSYSNPKFLESHTLKFVMKLIENIRSEVVDALGQHAFSFIEKLTYNFSKKEELNEINNASNTKDKQKNQGHYFSINSSVESNKVGMMALGLQAYNMVLSFKTSEFCLNKLFYNEKGEMYHTFEHFKKLYIPGGFADYHDENLLLMIKHIDENYSIYGTQMGLYECVCGFLYTIGDCTRPYYIGTCPSCNGQIGGTGHKLLDGHKNLISADNRNEEGRKKYVLDYLKSKLRNLSGYISKMADELSVHYCIRATSAVGFRFLNHVVSSILLLLEETEVVKSESLDAVVEIKGLKIKAYDYLVKHLNTDLIKIGELIKSKEYYIFMHVILGEFYNLAKENFKFDTSIEREKVEVAFQTKIIQPRMDRLAGEISDFKQFFITDKKLTFLSIIDEDYAEHEVASLNNHEYYRCFRYTRIGCWDDLKNEFLRNKKQDVNYQFMKILAEKFDELQLVGNLHPIIQFTNYMMNLCNYRFSRAEAKEKKIREVIEGNDVAIKLFGDFCNAWEKIAYKTTRWACKELPVLDRIDADLPLSFVLVDDRELGYGMYMAAAFQYLSMIQNEVLEAIVYLIKENNNYQIWGNMDTMKYPVQKISPHEIVMYQTDKNFVQELTDDFSKFYDIYNPKYGQGGIVEYNFEKIESELAFKLLTNKRFINYEDLTKVQYKFELLSIQNKNSNLLNDIRSKVDQKVLSYDDQKDIKKALERLEKQNVAYLHQIFSSLEIVLCNLRYGDAGSTENSTVSVYISRLPSADKISNFLKTTEPLNSVMLSNVLSFYGLVEEQLFKYIIEFISPDYCRPLEEDVVREILKWWNEFYEYAKDQYPSPDQLIKVIQRFIIRCLVASLEPKFPIKEYLNRIDFWDVDMNEDIIDNFYFEFPDSVIIANTMSFLDLMKEYQRSLTDDGRNVDFTQDKYKFDAIREEIFKKQNKFN